MFKYHVSLTNMTKVKLHICFNISITFLAPIGAQEMLIFVRSFVRLFVRSCQVCLVQSIIIILAQIFKQLVRKKSAVSEHSGSTQSIKIRVNTIGAYKYCVLLHSRSNKT